MLLSSGKLLLGSLYGALCIIPDELHKSDFVPPIVFSHLDIYQNNTSRRQDIYSNDEAQYLQPDERNFTITFAALDYVNSPAIKYVYRIKGLNDQWIELGNNRSASLVNVPAGDYLFQVKSTNADGVWVDNVASLSIHIDPVFGETVWAVLLYITMATFSNLSASPPRASPTAGTRNLSAGLENVEIPSQATETPACKWAARLLHDWFPPPCRQAKLTAMWVCWKTARILREDANAILLKYAYEAGERYPRHELQPQQKQ